MEGQIQDFQSKYKLNSEKMKAISLPSVGKRFQVDGIIYEVKYVRANPCRFSAEPVGVLHAPTTNDVPKIPEPVKEGTNGE